MHKIKVLAISRSACAFSSSCNREKQLKLYNLQKDVISTQKQPGCKKKVWLCSKILKKVVKSKGNQEMAMIVWVDGKNFNNNNSGEFCADS